MGRDVALDSLYSGQINLWVEDVLTREYLNALWGDTAVKFLVGGGHGGVQAILKNAEDAGYKNVFGVVDRDFGESNVSDWLRPEKTSRRFVLPRHEIENYLLEASALHESNYHNRGLEVVAIENRMVERAEALAGGPRAGRRSPS